MADILAFSYQITQLGEGLFSVKKEGFQLEGTASFLVVLENCFLKTTKLAAKAKLYLTSEGSREILLDTSGRWALKK